jgi:hypothetical protein
MNKEQQELLDESYKDYFVKKSSETGPFGVAGIIPTKDEFINNCKTDTEFSEKWGLKIEERELSLGERTEYKKKRDGISRTFAPYTHQMLDGSNIPTKLITITYNDTKLESYE